MPSTTWTRAYPGRQSPAGHWLLFARFLAAGFNLGVSRNSCLFNLGVVALFADTAHSLLSGMFAVIVPLRLVGASWGMLCSEDFRDFVQVQRPLSRVGGPPEADRGAQRPGGNA